MPAGGDGELTGRSYTGFWVQADQVRHITDDSPTSEMFGAGEVRLKLQRHHPKSGNNRDHPSLNSPAVVSIIDQPVTSCFYSLL